MRGKHQLKCLQFHLTQASIKTENSSLECTKEYLLTVNYLLGSILLAFPFISRSRRNLCYKNKAFLIYSFLVCRKWKAGDEVKTWVSDNCRLEICVFKREESDFPNDICACVKTTVSYLCACVSVFLSIK